MAGNQLPRRTSIASVVETSVLAKSARRCALCYHLDGNLAEKLGQIAHIDGDRSNADEANLAWMCLEHHSLFDSSTSQHKNYTISELKTACAKLYKLVSQGKHLVQAGSIPNRQPEADKKVFEDLLRLLPSNGAIKFVRDKDFGNSFVFEDVQEIHIFLEDRNGPDHEFLDLTLEKARQKLRKACSKFTCTLATNTFPTDSGRQGIERDLEMTNWTEFNRIIKEINEESLSLCAAYDDLIRLGRKKLG
jgi:hypothetical protein